MDVNNIYEVPLSYHAQGLDAEGMRHFGLADETPDLAEWTSGNQTQQRSAEDDLGGTMRLGAYPCLLEEGTLAKGLYGDAEISERHRHRYEVNIAFREKLEEAGMRFSGLSPDGSLPEIIERPDHPWFVGVQFHPELKSKPFDPHPLFTGFVAASMEKSRLV